MMARSLSSKRGVGAASISYFRESEVWWEEVLVREERGLAAWDKDFKCEWIWFWQKVRHSPMISDLSTSLVGVPRTLVDA
jgi:hypothetical protein